MKESSLGEIRTTSEPNWSCKPLIQYGSLPRTVCKAQGIWLAAAIFGPGYLERG